jgi:hypothetical protein
MQSEQEMPPWFRSRINRTQLAQLFPSRHCGAQIVPMGYFKSYQFRKQEFKNKH